MGFVSPWQVGSSRTRDQTCVPCTSRWILNHCATREVPWTSSYPSPWFKNYWLFVNLALFVFHPLPHFLNFPKYWNRSFLLSSAQRTPVLTIFRWGHICGSLEVQQRSYNTWLEQKIPRLDALMRVRGTFSLYLCHPSPKAAQLSAKTFSTFNFSNGRKLRTCEWVPSFPSCVGCCQRCTHFFLTPFRILRYTAWLKRREGQDIRSQGSQKRSKRNGSYWMLCRLHQEACPWASEDASPADPPIGLWAIPVHHVPHMCMHACTHTHTHIHTVACSQCKFPRVASMKLRRWLVSTCRNPAQLCGIGRKHTNLRTQHHPKARQTKSCQHPGWLCRIERMHTVLWIPPSRGNKNCRSGIGINSEKRSEKASEFLEGLTKGMSPLKTVSKDWKKWWLLQMWTQQRKTSNNMKNQGDLTSQ